MNFIASPEIVSALALAGRLSFNPLTDSLLDAEGRPFKLVPPGPASEVPADGFDLGRATYIAPPQDSSGIDLQIDRQSSRLQVMKPWPAWDGRDYVDLPVLVKTQGKTTTDHISPAGRWLRYRGHLDRFSDNMFSGATNAFADKPGMAIDPQDNNQEELPIASVARKYKAKGVNWIVVGDQNYGEGSSREHAALSPRLLGCVAVIARSFARIHETNLKKQGLLALTFQAASDYDLVRSHDRISLIGLAGLQAGVSVECLIKHIDGSCDRILLNHTFSQTQVEWFRKGSALNL
jgi:aconitate hydratase